MEFWALIYWLLVDYSFKSNFLPQTEYKPSPLTKEVRQTKEIGNKTLLNHSHQQGHMLTGEGTTSEVLNKNRKRENISYFQNVQEQRPEHWVQHLLHLSTQPTYSKL